MLFVVMDIKKRICIILLSGLLSLLYVDISFSDEKINLSILDKLRKVDHSPWQEKERIIKEIHRGTLKLSEVEKDTIIDMFEKESKFQQEYVTNAIKQGISLNKSYENFHELYDKKGYADYFIDFATFVSSFKDVRAIPGSYLQHTPNPNWGTLITVVRPA